MGERSPSMGPTAPRPTDLVRMLGQLRRGSAGDAPLGILAALKELLRTPGGAPDSPLNASDVDRSDAFRDLATPKLSRGEEAFDFELARVDVVGGREIRTGEMVRLSTYRHVQPVALIFGSYTWPPFRAQLGALEAIRERFAGRVEFFIVYIKEAHPEDGWALTYNRRSGIELRDPQSVEERTEVAVSCAVRMRTSIPVLIDDLDNEVAREYGGWPDRLYLIGADGLVAFQGAAGPFGFKPEELERAIEAELSSAAAP